MSSLGINPGGTGNIGSQEIDTGFKELAKKFTLIAIVVLIGGPIIRKKLGK